MLADGWPLPPIWITENGAADNTPVVEGACGQMCDWKGDPLHAGSAGYVVALGDPARLDDVLEALACHGH